MPIILPFLVLFFLLYDDYYIDIRFRENQRLEGFLHLWWMASIYVFLGIKRLPTSISATTAETFPLWLEIEAWAVTFPPLYKSFLPPSARASVAHIAEKEKHAQTDPC